MWNEPFDPSMVGTIDMVVLCHTREDTIALADTLRSLGCRWRGGLPLEGDLYWKYSEKEGLIAYDINRDKRAGWSPHDFYETTDGEYGRYRKVTFRAGGDLPEFDASSNTTDFLLI